MAPAPRNGRADGVTAGGSRRPGGRRATARAPIVAVLMAVLGCQANCQRASSSRFSPGSLAADATDARSAPGDARDAALADRDAAVDATDGPTRPADARSPLDGSHPGGPGRLVVVTLNTHGFQEGAGSVEKLRIIGDRLGRLDVDLVGLNEVMSGTFWAYDFGGAVYDGAELIREALEAASGMAWHVHRQVFAHWADGEEMSNVLLSRYPIPESDHAWLTTTDFWPAPSERRCVIYARVELPGLGPINVFVTHTAGFDSADTEVQIGEVKAFMAGKAVGDEAAELLLGDLNTPSTSPAYQTWLHAPPVELIDTYAVANPDGFADPTMVGGEHRIDYVLARADGALGADRWAVESFLVFDGREVRGVPLPVVSDHKGVVTTLSLPQ